MTLNELVASINSREDFIAFVQVLARDFSEQKDEWENWSIEDYLDALARWLEAMGDRVPAEASWKLFGECMIAAKYYE